MARAPARWASRRRALQPPRPGRRTESIEQSGIWTLTLALVASEDGKWFNCRLPWLEHSNIPPAVSTGLVISLALAVMRRLNARYGVTPRALLGISIAASLLQDTANALLLALAFRWLG